MSANGSMNEIVGFRAPPRLAEALRAEAKRQMQPRSVLVRWALADWLGLFDGASVSACGKRLESEG